MLRIISDLHMNPGDKVPDNLADKFCGANSNIHILLGDIINVLPLGMGVWRTEDGVATIKDIIGKLMPDYWVFGNHEGRMAWLRELLKPYVGIKVIRSLDIGRYHFEHGHKLTEWWLLRHIADDLVELATNNALTRKWWYDFCKKRGWMPGSFPHNPKDLRGFYWAMAFRASVKSEKIYVVGHSHVRVDIMPKEILGGVVDIGAGQVVTLYNG